MNRTRKRRSMGRSAWPERLDRLAARGRLTRALERLPDERQRALILLRHGLGLSWPAIRSEAEKKGLCYCERQLFRIYAQALRALEAVDES
ncbi:MAG: hypothetical protein IK149_02545 [Oscillospiraceae bacterium]|nr:hypothetical protein [Oscillospiraceae bacterium]